MLDLEAILCIGNDLICILHLSLLHVHLPGTTTRVPYLALVRLYGLPGNLWAAPSYWMTVRSIYGRSICPIVTRYKKPSLNCSLLGTPHLCIACIYIPILPNLFWVCSFDFLPTLQRKDLASNQIYLTLNIYKFTLKYKRNLTFIWNGTN